MTIALVNGRVVLPGGVREGLSVVVDGPVIASVSGSPHSSAAIVDLGGATLLPGFIDIQVNGGGGVLFNDCPTPEGIAAIGAVHRRFGTTGFLPTLISDDLETVARAIAAVDEAIAARVPGVLGIHIEGPFLAEPRRGIHRADKLRSLRDEDIALLTSLKRGRTLLTVAPEAVTPAQIRELVTAGVIVALGHSEADYECTRSAFVAGARGVTHLFNAMSGFAHRAPGMAGAALENDGVFAGVIADGHHIHPAALRIAVKAKGADRIMLVTDAMPSVGSHCSEFDLQGRPIRLARGMLADEAGTLAGSHLTMAGAFANVMEQTGLGLDKASRMASATPAAFLGLDGRVGSIAPGKQADLLAMDATGRVIASWIAGVEQRFD
jgi:N-acetylglucosamine-6-phosphate deacetylase